MRFFLLFYEKPHKNAKGGLYFVKIIFSLCKIFDRKPCEFELVTEDLIVQANVKIKKGILFLRTKTEYAKKRNAS